MFLNWGNCRFHFGLSWFVLPTMFTCPLCNCFQELACGTWRPSKKGLLLPDSSMKLELTSILNPVQTLPNRYRWSRFCAKILGAKLFSFVVSKVLRVYVPAFQVKTLILVTTRMCNNICTTLDDVDCPKFSNQARNSPILAICRCVKPWLGWFARYLPILLTTFCMHLVIAFQSKDIKQKRQ